MLYVYARSYSYAALLADGSEHPDRKFITKNTINRNMNCLRIPLVLLT